MRLINRRPGRAFSVFLAALPFVALAIAYSVASEIRLAANPSDRLLPSLAKLADTAVSLMIEGDRRTGRILLWYDTGVSLARLFTGVSIAAVLGLSVGLLIGLLPHFRAALGTLVAVLSMIPPLAILPILFIIFGLGELAKVVLIVLGITPFLIRDMSQRVMDIPRELIVKSETLGASSLVIAIRVALPLVMPRLIQAVRLSLGPAWLFLIAAEAIASDLGLGYRIFLVRRYLAMDVILTYVAWITLLAFLVDWGLRALSRRAYPWAGGSL